MTEQAASPGTIPTDLVQVGFVSGAYGVVGGLRVRPFSDDADALLGVKNWWLDKPVLCPVTVRTAKLHGGDVVTQLKEVAGRDAAEALKGAAVFISRSLFPPLEEGEFYWSDLIGLDVVNLQGESLGKVGDMMHNGAQSILRVTPVGADAGATALERLIPYVDQFVKTVDLDAKTITVDWGLDY